MFDSSNNPKDLSVFLFISAIILITEYVVISEANTLPHIPAKPNTFGNTIKYTGKNMIDLNIYIRFEYLGISIDWK